MNVIDLHDTETYRSLQKINASGFIGEHLIPPMRYQIEVDVACENHGLLKIAKLDEIFGEGIVTVEWVENYNAPWFYSLHSEEKYPLRSAKPIKIWKLQINLTTAEQLSYYILSHVT